MPIDGAKVRRSSLKGSNSRIAIDKAEYSASIVEVAMSP
jgi:hypothetical protein